MCALTVMSRGIFSRNLVLDEAGIRRGGTLVAWDDVDHYRYDWQDWSRPGDLLVIGRGARLLRIAPVFEQWPVVADRVLRELHARLRADPWFEPFAIEPDALVHASAGRLPLPDLERIELAAVGSSVLVVVHARGGGAWVEVDASQVANLWLWLELLVERGVSIAAPFALHLPPVLTVLGDRITAGQHLPRAIVRRT